MPFSELHESPQNEFDTKTMQALIKEWSEEDTEAVLALGNHIAQQLRVQGWCAIEQALPDCLTQALIQAQDMIDKADFKPAGIGRNQESQMQKSVRGDAIYWLQDSNNSPAQSAWLRVMETLKLSLNRQLFLGLFSYESHFAHYQKGDFYKKHLDAFRGKSNRVLSSVFYLNNVWDSTNGGELVIYDEHEDTREIARIKPKAGTLVIFLSEAFAHEVLPAQQERISIAGWFRINSSNSSQIDPPD